jgi:hypothetical protein
MKSVIPVILFALLILGFLIYVFIQMFTYSQIDCTSFRCGENNSRQALVFNLSKDVSLKNFSVAINGVVVGDSCDDNKELLVINSSIVVAPYYPNRNLISDIYSLEIFDLGNCSFKELAYNVSNIGKINYTITYPNTNNCFPLCRFSRITIEEFKEPIINFQ